MATRERERVRGRKQREGGEREFGGRTGGCGEERKEKCQKKKDRGGGG